MTAALLDAGELRRRLVAACRYLAFLEGERLALLKELAPDFEPGTGRAFIPLDPDVDALHHGNRAGPETGPVDRAPDVLRAAGLDPYAEAPWIEFIGRVPVWSEEKRPKSGSLGRD